MEYRKDDEVRPPAPVTNAPAGETEEVDAVAATLAAKLIYTLSTELRYARKYLGVLCGYMVQELLCNHLVAPIFGSPRAMFCRNLF